MPSQSSVSKSALDPVNLLVVGAAIAITFLPFTVAMVIQKSTDARAASPTSHVISASPAVPELKAVAAH